MKKIILGLILMCVGTTTWADEGMWLPQFLQSLNEKDMKKKGMKITAADIYSISKGSLKDAIVSLGSFCTAEVISEKGLLLTNHHCGFDAIQNHTTLENNYLRDGFWARSYNAELTNPGLTATFIISIDDVTNTILSGITAATSESERQALIEKNLAALKKSYQKESYQDIIIRSFFEGNKYFLFVTETYKDVRLVGAPPSSIGNYGKDTDNWMWPRHTGDFSLFRIYASKDNKPAAYSPDNVPYQPKRSLKISIKGLKEGDFTMVFGFPGRTMQYLPAAAVKQIQFVNDPTRIAIREKALQIMDQYMRKDESVKIKYAAKYASIQNAYKKWQGEILGLAAKNVVSEKEKKEAEFRKRITANATFKNSYGIILDSLQITYSQFEVYSKARDYYNEIIPRIELFGIASVFQNLVKSYEKDPGEYAKAKTEALNKLSDILKEYDANVDRNLFESLLQKYMDEQPGRFIAPTLLQTKSPAGPTNLSSLMTTCFQGTSFGNLDNISRLMNLEPAESMDLIKKDPVMLLYKDITTTFADNVQPELSRLQSKINRLQRLFMAAQMEIFPEKKFYPDANGTLRVTYGNVKGYKPRDAVAYGYYTYLDGVIEKYKPGDYEFDLPGKLITLWKNKDFGPYGVKGRQPVCFIGTNHTTGGNSGSPALDAYGNLVGLNFDRVWEGTMSDINYDPDICRNVMVDIRYVLFIIDKFAEAKNLISELSIVK